MSLGFRNIVSVRYNAAACSIEVVVSSICFLADLPAKLCD